ncbi:hypothetical protein ABID21_002891 [Pseudorhizobium tarimense]|uniref:Uncharacterized protein n=1 Tax=Pseudorhizobium tarimense TaxID=1079109 RepID=A0ABV2H8B7_9HYPH
MTGFQDIDAWRAELVAAHLDQRCQLLINERVKNDARLAIDCLQHGE